MYCCGGGNSTGTECENGDPPFVLEDGEMIFGRAALAMNGSGSTPDSSPDSSPDSETGCSNNEVAIGAGVGVPLGVLALAAVGWAFYERRRKPVISGPGSGHQIEKQEAQAQAQTQFPKEPTELEQRAMVHGNGVVEIG